MNVFDRLDASLALSDEETLLPVRFVPLVEGVAKTL